MNVKQNITVAALALSLVAGVAMATTGNTDQDDFRRGPEYGMMDSQGPHYQMRGFGGFGKGCGEQRGGRGMMGRSGGFGGHHGAMMNPEMRKKHNQFLDATKEIRKEVHDKQFALREARRDMSLTQGDLQKQQDDIFALRQQLRTQRQEIFKTAENSQ